MAFAVPLQPLYRAAPRRRPRTSPRPPALPVPHPTHRDHPRLALSGPPDRGGKPGSSRNGRPPASSPSSSSSSSSSNSQYQHQYRQQQQQQQRPSSPSTPSSSSSSSSSSPPPKAASPPLPPVSDFSDWSSDFLRLCNEQCSLLMATTAALEQVALFFRRENPATGALEFVPLMVHSAGTPDAPSRVWISAGAAGTTTTTDSSDYYQYSNSSSSSSTGHSGNRQPHQHWSETDYVKYDPHGAEEAAEQEDQEENASTSRQLPGSIPASWLIPDYPFATVPSHGGIALADGGLCVPVLYNDTVAATLILRRAAPDRGQQKKHRGRNWTEDETRRADMVAKTIALGAALEGKWHADRAMLRETASLMSSARALLRNTLHQVRNPIQALVTFGHLLMRRLPVNDHSRSVAKNIVVEALRVDELLHPLDSAGEALVLPALDASSGNNHFASEQLSPTGQLRNSAAAPGTSATADTGTDATFTAIESEQTGDAFAAESIDARDYYPDVSPARGVTAYVDLSAPNKGTYPSTLRQERANTPPFIWLADVLNPQVDAARLHAAELGISFSADLDEDTPPVRTIATHVREAVSNLLDNALKYSPPGAHVGVKTWLHEPDTPTPNFTTDHNGYDDDIDEDFDDDEGNDEAEMNVPYTFALDDAVEAEIRAMQSHLLGEKGTDNSISSATATEAVVVLAVFDTGFGVPKAEQQAVWEYGQRTSGALRSGQNGSGIGLSIVRDLVRQSGGAVSLLSPLPACFDPRDEAARQTGLAGSLFLLVLRRARR